MVSNAAIAELLIRYASVLAAGGGNRFKTKAYRRAAETVQAAVVNFADLVERGDDLTQFPGIGSGLSGLIEEIVRTGRFNALEDGMKAMSPQVAELTGKPLLDFAIVMRAYKKLGVNSLRDLQQRLEAGDVRATLGSRIEMHLRRGLDPRPRMLLRQADKIATAIEAFLLELPGVTSVNRTGSLRRKQETIGDLSFLVTGGKPADLFSHFGSFGSIVVDAPKRGRSRAVFRLSTGQTATLAHVPGKSLGLSLLKETGSAAHWKGIQDLARQQQVSLSVKSLAAKKIDASDEDAIYRTLGLAPIPPELREDRGEIAAALEKKLPQLIELADLKGDLHMHTTASDGGNTIAEMAVAAKARDYAYIAISDHSQSLKLTNGLTEKRLLQQIKEIDHLNARSSNFRILKSSEVDILEDGSLDYPKAVLRELDLTICSIHSLFRLDRDHQTERILHAMDNKYFNILGHATGRLLLSREGYEIDFERIARHARDCGCFFEINSNPNRLDLSDEHARLAKEGGVKIAVNTDAHSIAELDFMQGGIHQARRAWLEPSNVLNTLSLRQLLGSLKR